MITNLKAKMLEAIWQVLPITLIVVALSIFLIPLQTDVMVMFLVGAILLTVGMGMFQLGTEMAMSPLGEGIGVELSKSKKIIMLILVGLVMGILITVAEPDLQVLSNQVPSVPNATLIWTVAIGVGIFLAMAIVRIVLKVDLSILLMLLYAIMLIFSFFVPADFLSVAFDSGGVTTGPVTVPFIMALGVGLCSLRADKNASSDSFGLVALSSVGPILAVMILGVFFKPTEASYSAADVVSADTMREVFRVFVVQLPHYFKEVLITIFPIVVVFFAFQIYRRRYKRWQIWRILVGFGYTYLGLVLFFVRR